MKNTKSVYNQISGLHTKRTKPLSETKAVLFCSSLPIQGYRTEAKKCNESNPMRIPCFFKNHYQKKDPSDLHGWKIDRIEECTNEIPY